MPVFLISYRSPFTCVHRIDGNVGWREWVYLILLDAMMKGKGY